MADFTEIIQEINTNLPNNNTQSITAEKLRTTLIDLTNTIDTVQDDNETNLSDITNEISNIDKQIIYDVTLNNNGATFTSLASLLSDANISTLIPSRVRYGGMSIRFVNSSNNNYLQYKYVLSTIEDNNFINVNNWVDSANNAETETIINDTQINPSQSDLIDLRYYKLSSSNVGDVVTVTNKSYTGWKGFSPIDVKKGWKFDVSGTGNNNYRVFYLIDNDNVLRMIANTGEISGTFTINSDGILYVNSYNQEPKLSIYNLVKPLYTEFENLSSTLNTEFENLSDSLYNSLSAEEQERINTDNEIISVISKEYIAGNSFEGTYSGMNGKGIIFDKLFTQGTIIKNFSFVLKSDATAEIHIYIFTKSGDVFTVLKDFLNCGMIQAGEHTYELDYVCPVDCYIGIYNTTVSLNVEQSGEHTYNSYRITANGLVEGSTVTISSLFEYYPKYSVEYLDGFYDLNTINNDIIQNTTEINQLNLNTDKLLKNKSVLFDRQSSFDGELHLLTNCTLDSNNKVVSGTGDSYYLYWKRFISDQRKCVYDIEIPSSSTPIIRVGSLNTRIATDHKYSTCCEIDRTTNKLIIYKGGGSNGITTLTPIASVDIVNTVSSTRLLTEVERNRKITTFRVYDYYTRVYDEVSFDGNDVLFVNGAGNHRPYYFLYTNTADIKLNTLSVFGCYDVAYVHLGDSLSESNGRCDVSSTNTIGENWIEKVMNLIGWNGSIVAQSGASVDDVFDALTNEVQYIKPKTISVMIGTNHGATIQEYQDIINWCSSRGIQLIMCNIPMTATRPSTDVDSSEYVAEELDSLNIQVVRMNNATAIDGNPSNGSDLNAFSSDKLHTNQLGNDRMYERFLMDAPQIIYFVR